MLPKKSKYWRYQFLGWGILGVFSFFGIPDSPSFQNGLRDCIHNSISGILLSHLMYLSIRALKIVELSLWKLILPVFLLTIIFGIIYGILGHNSEEIRSIWTKNTMPQNEQLIIESFLSGVPLFLVWNSIYFFYHNQQRNKKRREKEKEELKLQAFELEAKALRAQMNPHFIFNCMNSIKSLMQEGDIDLGITYLTTFSKLIRTLFNNMDKKEISLYDEIETCKLYLQLEAMRFDAKFSYAIGVEEHMDLKSIQVPALIIQPFIENAIWHGIVPRNNGGHVYLNVQRKDDVIEVVIDDNGIGREASAQNRSSSKMTHQSKGVNLTQTRIELNNLLQQKQAKLEVVDKKDDKGIATGTKVIISIKEEL